MLEAEGRGIGRFKVPEDNPPPLISPFRKPSKSGRWVRSCINYSERNLKFPFLPSISEGKSKQGTLLSSHPFSRKRKLIQRIFFFTRGLLFFRAKPTRGASLQKKKAEPLTAFSLLLFFAEKVTHTASPHNMTPCEKKKKRKYCDTPFPFFLRRCISCQKRPSSFFSSPLPPSIPEG